MASPSIRVPQSQAIIKVMAEEKIDDELIQIIQDAYDNRREDMFFVGVSGGSFPERFIRVVTRLSTMRKIDWKKWLIYFCDERCVPVTHKDSTYGLFQKLCRPEGPSPLIYGNFVAVDGALRSNRAADDYTSKLKARFGQVNFPKFHIMFLGVGPDGHTASLFPGHRLLAETNRWVGNVPDSPKPPTERVTLTLPLLNNARRCVFVATGEDKAPVIKQILEDRKALPATMVKPHNGTLYWLMDEAAGSKLERKTWEM